MSTSPGLVSDLRPYLVQVLNPLGEVEGTGFVCHSEGYALTCWHVVRGWHKQGLKGEVLWEGQRVSAELLVERSVEAADLAVFKLSGAHAGQADTEWPVLPLDVHGRLGLQDQLRSFGYPTGKFDQSGIPIRGEIGGLEAIRVDGIEVLPIAGLNLDNVDAGYSGAPVFDERIGKVIGLVHARQHQTQAFIVPLASLFAAWPELRAQHDVFEHIRQQLGEQAQAALGEKLHAAPFIPLNLEAGRIEEKEKEQEGGQDGYAKAHGRTWERFDLKGLAPPRGRFVLSADVGTGKTTFAYWLAAELVRRTRLVPMVMACEELERIAPKGLDDILNALSGRLADAFSPVDLDDGVAEAKRSGRLVFLFDGLDQIRGEHPSDVVKLAFSIAGNSPVLIASRPSAINRALERDSQLTFLRLQPFSVRDQRSYFGTHYETAKAVCALAPDLTQVPMLAYMVRELVGKGKLKQSATRTELYGEFVRHVLTEHEANAPLQDAPGLISKVERALGKLAYDALSQAQPRIQRVPIDAYADEASVRLRDLIAFGLVNRILGSGEEALYFTHQSFQEFLAAKHAALVPDALDRVLANRGRAEWADVLKFLAGLMGEPFLMRLIHQVDVIGSGGYLAAECVTDLSELSVSFVDTLSNTLGELAGIGDFFLVDSIAALGKLGRWLRPQDVAYLVERSRLPDRRMAMHAIEALGHAAGQLNEEALGAIRDGAHGNDFAVCVASVEALARLGQLEPSDLLALLNALVTRNDVDANDPALFWHGWAVADSILNLPLPLWEFDTYHDPPSRDPLKYRDLRSVIPFLRGDMAKVQRIFGCALKGSVGRSEPGGIDEILERLRDDDAFVRAGALTALAAVRTLADQCDAEIAGAVVPMLSDGDDGVRHAACSALEVLGDRLVAEDQLKIVKLLSDGDAGVRRAAALALVLLLKYLHGKALRGIIDRLEDPDECARKAALEVVGLLGSCIDADAMRKVVSCLGDIHDDVRHSAVLAIDRLFNRNRIRQMYDLDLGDDDDPTNASSEDVPFRVEFLDGAAQRNIARSLREVDEDAFSAAIAIFVHLRDRIDAGVVREIAELTDGDDRDRRRWAVNALASLGGGWIALDSAVLRRIVDRLGDNDEDVRAAALGALASLGSSQLDAKAVRKMVERLDDSAEGVRHNALRALAPMGEWLPPEVVPQILKCLDDDDEAVRSAALLAVPQLSSDRVEAGAIRRIVGRLGDKNHDVRAAALEALASLGPDRLDASAIRKMVRRLNDREEWVRDAAAEALASLGQERLNDTICATLHKLNRGSVRARLAALKALTSLGSSRLDAQTVQAIAGQLGGTDPRLLVAALEALRELREHRAFPDVVQTIAERLKDEDAAVRRAAVSALGNENENLPSPADPETLSKMLLCLNDRDSDVRSAAAVALSLMEGADIVSAFRSKDGADLFQVVFRCFIEPTDEWVASTIYEAFKRLHTAGMLPTADGDKLQSVSPVMNRNVNDGSATWRSSALSDKGIEPSRRC